MEQKTEDEKSAKPVEAEKPRFDPQKADLVMRAQPGHAERGGGRPRRWFFPGRSPGQPYKANQYRVCYHISKTYGKNTTVTGDRLDYFLSEADRKINYFESQVGRSNPCNPHKMLAEFNIQVLQD